MYLKNLDDLQLSTSLDLESFKFSQGSVKVEDCVSLLQLLPLLFRRGQDHGLVRPVHLEEDGILLPLLVDQSLAIDQLVILLGNKMRITASFILIIHRIK